MGKPLHIIACIIFVFPVLGQNENLLIDGSFEDIICNDTDIFVLPRWHEAWYFSEDSTLYNEIDTPTHRERDRQDLPPVCNPNNSISKYDPAIDGMVPPYDGKFFWQIYSNNLDLFQSLNTYLKEPLKKDSIYFTSIAVALATWGKHTTDRFSIYASSTYDTTMPGEYGNYFKDPTVVYEHPFPGDYITNYNNWRVLRGCFKANGDEKMAFIIPQSPWNSDTMKIIPNRKPIIPNTVNTGSQVYYSFYLDAFKIKPLSSIIPDREFTYSYCAKEDKILDTSFVSEEELFQLPAEYTWSDGKKGLVRSFESSGIYTLNIDLNCEKAISIQFNIEIKDCSPKVYIPNVFSPNGDGINDNFEYTFENVDFKSIQIYDRYGELVFESHNPYYYWDGRGRNGNHLGNGVFVYSIKYNEPNGESKVVHGTVTLIR